MKTIQTIDLTVPSPYISRSKMIDIIKYEANNVLTDSAVEFLDPIHTSFNEFVYIISLDESNNIIGMIKVLNEDGTLIISYAHVLQSERRKGVFSEMYKILKHYAKTTPIMWIVNSESVPITISLQNMGLKSSHNIFHDE